MEENNVKIEGGREEMKENDNRKENNHMDYYHPFWSLLNDCFNDDNASDVMKTDISENQDGYLLEVEVPGVDKKDIRLSLDKGYLTIGAKINRHGTEGNGKYLRSERVSGSFSRSFYIGNSVSKENVSASCENGVLSVIIKKPKEVKQEEKFIEIK